MRTPSEVVVWYVLPVIRRELTVELVQKYGLKQSEVGRYFGVTNAAVSQYVKNKRGGNEIIESSSYYPGFRAEIRKSAEKIHEGADTMSELCRLCNCVKDMGLLAEVYSGVTGCPMQYSESLVSAFSE